MGFAIELGNHTYLCPVRNCGSCALLIFSASSFRKESLTTLVLGREAINLRKFLQDFTVTTSRELADTDKTGVG